MSRANVRSTVANFFAPPAVTGLNRIYTARPKRINVSDFRYGQPAGTWTGAVGVVTILGETEERIALGGATSGKKWVTYQTEIEVFCHSIRTHSEDAMSDFDGIMDGIKAKLRSDRWLNNYPVIFQAGEKQLEGAYGDPKVLGDGATEIWAALRFEVSEVINS